MCVAPIYIQVRRAFLVDMETSPLLSRSAIGELSQVKDDVLGFWIRKGVLKSETEAQRKHHRFTMDEARIAAIVNGAHAYGLNVSALSEIAAVLRKALSAYRAAGWEGLLRADKNGDRDLYKLLSVGAAIDDCGDMLLLANGEDSWSAELVGGLDQLPVPTGIVFDLARVLSHFKGQK